MTTTAAAPGAGPAPTGLSGLLLRSGMSLTEAARVTGVPEADLERLCRGQAAGIRFTTLAAVCAGLGCTPAQLLEPLPTPSSHPTGRPRWWIRAWAWRAPRLVRCSTYGTAVAATVLSVVVLYRLMPADWRDRPVPIGVLTVWGVGNIVTASHLIFGQINVFLMALVLIDLTCTDRSKPRWLPVGVLTGVAAAVKLTPALFIVHLWVSGQHRAARTSTLTAACATSLGFLVYPGPSWQFFTATLWGLSDRVSLDGLFATSGNQSVHGALAALGPGPSPLALGLSAVIMVAGLAVATTAHRAGRVWAAVLIVGLTACLVSPVSWMHHWVYLPPALVLLAQHHHPVSGTPPGPEPSHCWPPAPPSETS